MSSTARIQREAYRNMESAPLTGKPVRLLLKDWFGDYPFSPCKWDTAKKRWINARSGADIAVAPIGWLPLKSNQAVEYGTQD